MLSEFRVPDPITRIIIPQSFSAPHFAGRKPEAQRDGAMCLTFPSSDVMESGFEPELDLSCLKPSP